MGYDAKDETKFVKKIEEQRGTTYVTEQGSYVKRTPKSFSVYDSDPRGPHGGSLHINKKEDGSYHVKEKKDGKSTESSCYLTTACLKYLMEEFDDTCYELTTLRRFRDTYVSAEDVAKYYEMAPQIVSGIETLSDEEQEAIYAHIYEYVVHACVQFIEKGEYNSAYERYKESLLVLQSRFAVRA